MMYYDSKYYFTLIFPKISKPVAPHPRFRITMQMVSKSSDSLLPEPENPLKRFVTKSGTFQRDFSKESYQSNYSRPTAENILVVLTP